MELINSLFIEWNQGTWANILEVIGFAITIITLVTALRVRSQVARLKLSYIFDQRIKDHISKLDRAATNLKDHLRDYVNSINDIREVLMSCEAELKSLSNKLDGHSAKKTHGLLSFVKSRHRQQFKAHTKKDSPLVFRFKKIWPWSDTSYDDVWLIYFSIRGLVNELNNLKLDKNKSLK
jgi:hypothetical protein